MYSFAYSKADTVADAVSLVEKDQEAKYLSGGMSLIPSMKLRLASPSRLIDVTKIPALHGISEQADRVRIGAATTHYEVLQSAVIQNRIPALGMLASKIGDVQVRYRGTIGGSIANNDPAADYPAGAVGLDAKLITDRRSISADDFFRGLFDTALEPGELLTGVELCIPRRATYIKFANLASRFAIIGVFLADFGDAVRIAVTGGGTGVFRLKEHEAALASRFDPEVLSSLTIPLARFSTDVHATAEYRAHLTAELTKQAVEACLNS